MRPNLFLLTALVVCPILACGDGTPSEPLIQTEEPANIVFYSRRGGTLAKIYTMKPDGSGIEALTDGVGNDLWPDLSPDGRRVVFTSNRGGDNDIYMLELATRTVTSLTRDPADDNWPRWSPDGRQIAFHSNRGGNYDILVMDADGSNPRRVTRDAALDQWPEWSPDGRRLAFRRANDIHVADAAGEERNVAQLTFVLTSINQMPAWSPNGRQIAFMSMREGYCAVFLMEAAGSSQVNLTPKDPTDAASAWCSRAPTWSRDGRQIYFMSFRPSTAADVELFGIDADGSDLVRLTTSPGEDGGPRTR